MVDLDTRLRSVLGDKTAKALESAFDTKTVDDLLRHYPRRYADIGQLTDLSDLMVGQHVTIMARVVSAKNYAFRNQPRKTRTEVVVTDGTGRLTLTFFQQAWRLKTLTEGKVGLFAGEVGEYRGTLQLTHPDFEPVDGTGEISEDSRLGRGIIPIYPASAKVASWRIEQSVAICLDGLAPLDDPVPDDVRAQRGLSDVRTALEEIHRPRAKE